MAKRKKGAGTDSRFLLLIIVGCSIALFFATLFGLQKLFQTETYYVLNQDVPTRTQVTAEMLDPVVASEGGAPKAAIGLEDVQTGQVYTQYPLHAGDILTLSNVGALNDISVGVPDEWVVTSFSVSADEAVGGRIRRGTYFDIMVATSDGAFYPFVNVLALDTTVSLSNASSADAVDTEEAHAGQTSQYVVAMSPENAAKLQSVVQKYSQNLKLVLSPRANEYQKPSLSDYNGMFSYDPSNGPVWPGESAQGEVTDNTFTDAERDSLGKPIKRPQDCSEGNARISGKACEKTGQSPSEQPSPQASETPSPSVSSGNN